VRFLSKKRDIRQNIIQYTRRTHSMSALLCSSAVICVTSFAYKLYKEVLRKIIKTRNNVLTERNGVLYTLVLYRTWYWCLVLVLL